MTDMKMDFLVMVTFATLGRQSNCWFGFGSTTPEAKAKAPTEAWHYSFLRRVWFVLGRLPSAISGCGQGSKKLNPGCFQALLDEYRNHYDLLQIYTAGLERVVGFSFLRCSVLVHLHFLLHESNKSFHIKSVLIHASKNNNNNDNNKMRDSTSNTKSDACLEDKMEQGRVNATDRCGGGCYPPEQGRWMSVCHSNYRI